MRLLLLRGEELLERLPFRNPIEQALLRRSWWRTKRLRQQGRRKLLFRYLQNLRSLLQMKLKRKKRFLFLYSRQAVMLNWLRDQKVCCPSVLTNLWFADLEYAQHQQLYRSVPKHHWSRSPCSKFNSRWIHDCYRLRKCLADQNKLLVVHEPDRWSKDLDHLDDSARLPNWVTAAAMKSPFN
jgi:hypothetical protein